MLFELVGVVVGVVARADLVETGQRDGSGVGTCQVCQCRRTQRELEDDVDEGKVTHR